MRKYLVSAYLDIALNQKPSDFCLNSQATIWENLSSQNQAW